MFSRIYQYFFPVSAIPVEPKVSSKPLHPLFYAVEEQNIVEVQSLLRFGADLEMKDDGGNTALIYAADKNDIQAIRLLFNDGALLETRGNSGYTALHVAALQGCAQAAKMLISLGADMESRSETQMGTLEGGITPLWSAVTNNHEEVVRLLVTAGANVNVMDGNGHTVLSFAVYCGNPNIVGMLLGAGADPRLAGVGGTSAIDRAKAHHQEMMLNLLENNLQPLDLVRQKRLQYFENQGLFHQKAGAADENHLRVTRSPLI